MTCLISAVSDWSGARRKRSWYISTFEIVKTQGGRLVLCESVGFGYQVERVLVPVRVVFDMGYCRPLSNVGS